MIPDDWLPVVEIEEALSSETTTLLLAPPAPPVPPWLTEPPTPDPPMPPAAPSDSAKIPGALLPVVLMLVEARETLTAPPEPPLPPAPDRLLPTSLVLLPPSPPTAPWLIAT